MQQQKTRVSWLASLFFLCGVHPSSEKKMNMKKSRLSEKQLSITRLSFSDFGKSASPKDLSSSLVGSNLHIFTLAELKLVTRNFSNTNLLGEGGFGPVYKGQVDEKLRPGLKRQTVAVKLLDLEGMQGHKEWLAEVIFLGQLRHTNLVKLIGYCYEDEHRLLVYEFMERGSLENHLFQKFVPPLPWKARMRIAVGAAKGLAFLHEAEQPVIYRDFKASNILLDSDYEAKLSDFGLAKDGPLGDETHVSTRVMGTQGYAAPEYIMTGHLSARSDVFSFGVVLLELLTGRRSVDKNRCRREESLVEWAKPHLRDHRRIYRIIDPCLLDGNYSTKAAQIAASLAYQCLSHRPKSRPHISTVVSTLESIQDLDVDIKEPVIVYVATEDGNMLLKEETKNKDVVEPPAINTNRHCHKRRGARYLKSISYSDTALYRNCPTRRRNGRT